MRTRIRTTGSRRLLLLGTLLLLAGGASGGEGVVGALAGDVELGRGEPPRWEPASQGVAMAPGDQLRTGRDGRAEVRWMGATIRLYGDSLLRLPVAAHPATSVELEGAGLFDVSPRSRGAFEVQTPDVVVSVKGTRFGVGAMAGPAEVWVYRGSVGVRPRNVQLREVLVREGFRSVGGALAPAELYLLDHEDPWQDWSRRPMPRMAQAPPAARLPGEADPSVRRAVKQRALNLALQRNPRLARRMVEIRGEMRAAMADKMEDRQAALQEGVDPILDGTKEEAKLVLKSNFAEQMMQELVEVTFLSDGTILMNDPDGTTSWELDADVLIAYLEGSAALPTEFTSTLGIQDPEKLDQLATNLLALLSK